MDTDQIKETITVNAAEAARLHQRIHDTFWLRDQGQEQREQWPHACAEFHARYDALAFPGGYTGALERIASGDAYAMEAGICFLELRPYFFSFRLHVQRHLAEVQASPAFGIASGSPRNCR
jgi:hypothetical protein